MDRCIVSALALVRDLGFIDVFRCPQGPVGLVEVTFVVFIPASQGLEERAEEMLLVDVAGIGFLVFECSQEKLGV